MSDQPQISDRIKLDDELVIDNLETLKVVADPLRKRIMDCFDKPRTVKEVAKALGTNASKLYYHVNLLEEHGLLKVTDTRIVSGIIEKQYKMAATHLRIKQGLLSPSSSDGDESLNMILTHMFDGTKEEIRESIVGNTIDLTAEQGHPRKLFLTRLKLMLTPEKARALSERLNALVDEMGEDADEETPGEASYMLTMAFFPTHEKPISDTDDEPEST